MEKSIQPRTYEWVKEKMRKANERYRNSNRERFNQKQKEYYESHKNDEEYLQKMRERARKRNAMKFKNRLAEF